MGLFDNEEKSSLSKDVPRIPRGKIALVVLIIAIVVVAYVFSTQLLSNVHKGYYEVRQSWITGQVSAKMTPGWWVKVGDITQWPKAETYYFTKGQDSKFDTRDDHSIVVQFNEGSDCNISGTCRVTLPKTEKEAVALTVEHGYRNWDEVLYKLVQPQVRKALILAANQMTARESVQRKKIRFYLSDRGSAG